MRYNMQVAAQFSDDHDRAIRTSVNCDIPLNIKSNQWEKWNWVGSQHQTIAVSKQWSIVQRYDKAGVCQLVSAAGAEEQ